MAKAFSKNKKLNKIMKDINKMKNKEINICLKAGENLHTTTIISNDIIKFSLNNEIFIDCINTNDRILSSILKEYYSYFKHWSSFNANYNNTINELKFHFEKDGLDRFIKAKNGDKYSLSYINGIISVFFILFNYFKVNILDEVKKNEGFTIHIL